MSGKGSASILRMPWDLEDQSDMSAIANEALNALAYSIGTGILLSENRKQAKQFAKKAIEMLVTADANYQEIVDDVGEPAAYQFYAELVSRLAREIGEAIKDIGEDQT